jgi:hypothetical protein
MSSPAAENAFTMPTHTPRVIESWIDTGHMSMACESTVAGWVAPSRQTLGDDRVREKPLYKHSFVGRILTMHYVDFDQ